MKRYAWIAAIGLAFSFPLLSASPPASSSRPAETERYKIDSVHSSVVFAIKHMNVAIFRGRFNEITGSLAIDSKNPENSSIEITIPTGSVDSNNEKRDQHLKSPDFFNAKQFPKITFKSTKVKSAGEGKLEIEGELSLHGVTKPVTVHATHIGTNKGGKGGTRLGYDATFRIKRSEFGMKFMLEGLSDEVDITIGIEAVQE